MTRYSIEPRDSIFEYSNIEYLYGFLFFDKNMSKNVGNKISKILSGRYNHKLPDHAKQSATDALKSTLKKVIQKTVEETGDLIGNKMVNKIAKVSRTSLQKILETVTNETEILDSTEKCQKENKYLHKKDSKLLMI